MPRPDPVRKPIEPIAEGATLPEASEELHEVMSSRPRREHMVIRVVRALTPAVLIYVFLTAIDLMGLGFKLMGTDVAERVMTVTENPFTGLLIGILSTAVVQSSSVTTSMTVGLVSAGAISIGNAVPIVMGANVGTTVTCAIVSFGHITRREEFQRGFAAAVLHDIFNILAVGVLLPIELATGVLEKAATSLGGVFSSTESVEFHSPVKMIVDPFSNLIADTLDPVFPGRDRVLGLALLVLAFAGIYFSLFFLVKFLKRSLETRVTAAIYAIVNSSAVICMAAGAGVTALIQSSSITTSILVPLVACRVIELEHGFPITLGANLGTTATAILASLAGNPHGLIVAFVHLLFNLTGILLFYPVRAIRRIPLSLARRLADVVSRRRWLAVVWVLVLFFGLPVSLIWATGGFS